MARQVSLLLVCWNGVACSKGLNLKRLVSRNGRNHVSLLSEGRLSREEVLQYLRVLLKLLA